ncbi:hypothetical protein LAZ67_23000622 [Cordylochernes scorpioides]|uniref:Mos1 transposase HTH domain-containing protein n=1 Tax=Cordylochernes scorpioides TaxID=51811 RepID=A0ABY6LQ47_9ARAC|nr:hypothetical protein LAZ67_23000622 [Cordylochernes scorpioides]
MELPLVNVSTCELRSVIRFFTAKNETAVNIHRNLVSVYGEGCMSIQMVRRWRSWFLEGRQNVHDDERSDRPVTATDNAAVAAVRNVVEANRRVTIDEIMIRLPPGIEIGCSSIGTIMFDHRLPQLIARVDRISSQISRQHTLYHIKVDRILQEATRPQLITESRQDDHNEGDHNEEGKKPVQIEAAKSKDGGTNPPVQRNDQSIFPPTTQPKIPQNKTVRSSPPSSLQRNHLPGDMPPSPNRSHKLLQALLGASSTSSSTGCILTLCEKNSNRFQSHILQLRYLGKDIDKRIAIMEVETLIKKLKRIKKSIKGIEENIESIVSMVDVNATKCKLEYANNDLMKMSDIFLQQLEDDELNDEVENCIDKCIRLKCELDLRHNGQETSEKKVNLHVKMPKLELPTFDGRLESWLSFKDLFFSAVGSNSQIPNIEKLQYLKGQLRGEALRLVNAFPITADNYVEVWQTLLTRYDNPKDLIFTQIDNALRLPKLADDNHKSMFKLLDSCNEIVRTVKVLGYQIDSLSDVFLVKIIQDKLDKTTRKQWELQNNPRVVPSSKDLMEFLEIHAKSLQNLPNKDANVKESSIKRETAPRMEVQQKQWGHPGRSPMDYSSKRRPCRICLNRGHAGRFHPENRCWFREKAVQASPAASFMSVPSRSMDTLTQTTAPSSECRPAPPQHS